MNRFVAFCLSFSLAPTASMAQEPPQPAKQPSYTTPQAVFDAYRVAKAKADFATVFGCVLPERIECLVDETYFGCLMAERDPKFAAVLKKYCATSESINRDYSTLYKQKHGIDWQEAVEEARRKGKPPPADDELRIKATNSAIKDKVGFFVAANRARTRPIDMPDHIGELTLRSCKDDSATGAASNRIYHLENGKTKWDDVETMFEFKKSKGNWYIVNP